MFLSMLLFAVNTLLIRAISLHFPAADGWMASLFRGITGIAVVFALHGRGRGFQPSHLFTSRLLLLRGLVGGAAIIIYYTTIVKLGASRAVIINLTYPLFGSIIAAVWLREKLGRTSILWMLAGLLGLALFLGGGIHHGPPSPYDLLGLLGAVAAGWVIVIIRRLRNEEHPSTIYASQAAFSFFIAAPAATRLPELPSAAWAGLALAAVVVAAGQLTMTRAYHRMSVVKGSAIQMLLPIVTGIGGFLCFGETFTPVELLGAALTLFATWRVTLSR